MSCDWYSRAADLDVNILAHSDHLGRSRTDGSHRLIGIGCHDIYNAPPPSKARFLIAADPRAMAARPPYLEKVDDFLGDRGHCEVQSVEQGRWWFS